MVLSTKKYAKNTDRHGVFIHIEIDDDLVLCGPAHSRKNIRAQGSALRLLTQLLEKIINVENASFSPVCCFVHRLDKGPLRFKEKFFNVGQIAANLISADDIIAFHGLLASSQACPRFPPALLPDR